MAALFAGYDKYRERSYFLQQTADALGEEAYARGQANICHPAIMLCRDAVVGTAVPSRMIWSGSRAVTCGDQIN